MIQISKQDLLKQLYKSNTPGLIEKINNHKIGIAGCGGLGSNIAMMLVRSGVSNLVLVDYDKVELSNLNRQHFFQEDIGKNKTDALHDILNKINPYLNIIPINQRLLNENIFKVFKDCSIIVEAFDNIESKSMILKAFSDDRFNSKYLIGASGLAGINSSNTIRTKQIGEKIFICGDFRTEVNTTTGLMSPRVMLVAAHQANMVLRVISGLRES